ncbi:MAG: HAMP domain-containing histidine kinase, partial [Chitinispirillales bacterium]|nr:HAMP domain-containing histidine kinase [Chitinispirillales bacterium]
MKNEKKIVKHSLFTFWEYVFFFLIVFSLIAVSHIIFASLMDINFEVNIRKYIKVTLFNVLFFSSISTVIDAIRRKYRVERPVKQILSATRQITQGDFSVRIKPFRSTKRKNEFDIIIENFNKMAEELSGIETLRTDFIANISHELKTPLSIIQNYSTILQNPELPEEKRVETAKAKSNASRRLSELIANILKLNKLENQQIFPETTEYNVGEQLRECLLGFEDLWEEKGLDLEIDIDDVTIRADSELLALIWNNLFSNAIKFSNSGGKITVSLKDEQNYATATITDSGCGMAPEVKSRIFEKFYQGDTSRSTHGNGLGLALVKRVIDIAGGEISVKSATG